MSSGELLRVEDLKVYYYTLTGIVRAVDGVSLSARPGELIAVVGESGSGKSTLGMALLGMVPPPGKIVSGKVVIDGVEVTGLSGEELRRVRGSLVSMVFQDPFTTLDPVRRIGDQIVEVMTEHGVPEDEAEAKVPGILESLGLPADLAMAYPHQLSGGQRQRVSIAAAIALGPKLLVADEPTTALDVIVQKQIMDLLDDIRKKRGMTVMLITHDIALAVERADRIAIMYAGKIVEYGPTREILEDPLHPYTRGLLKSVPDLYSDRRPEPIPGNPPDLRDPPKGCRFRPRCPLAGSICSKEPKPREVDERVVSCWMVGGERR